MKKLTKHFSYKEVTHSETASRFNLNNTPNDEELSNLVSTLENVLEPVREHFNSPIIVSSGFRGKALNRAIKGSRTSQHCQGKAIDFHIHSDKFKNTDVFEYIKNNLEYDQLIGEFWSKKDSDYYWIHVSYDSIDNRHQTLVAERLDGKTYYKKG